MKDYNRECIYALRVYDTQVTLIARMVHNEQQSSYLRHCDKQSDNLNLEIAALCSQRLFSGYFVNKPIA